MNVVTNGNLCRWFLGNLWTYSTNFLKQHNQICVADDYKRCCISGWQSLYNERNNNMNFFSLGTTIESYNDIQEYLCEIFFFCYQIIHFFFFAFRMWYQPQRLLSQINYGEAQSRIQNPVKDLKRSFWRK